MNPSPAPLIRKIGLRYGIMLGFVLSVLFFSFVLFNLKTTNDWVYSLSVAIFIAVFIFLTHLSFKENNEGNMTFGQGVSLSFWAGLAAGVLTSLISYIYMKFNPKYLTDLVEMLRTDLEKKGMPDDQIDMTLNISSKFMTPEILLLSGILGVIFYALIFGLIIGIFTKKNPESPVF